MKLKLALFAIHHLEWVWMRGYIRIPIPVFLRNAAYKVTLAAAGVIEESEREELKS